MSRDCDEFTDCEECSELSRELLTILFYAHLVRVASMVRRSHHDANCGSLDADDSLVSPSR